jgi:hypothetical protein
MYNTADDLHVLFTVPIPEPSRRILSRHLELVGTYALADTRKRHTPPIQGVQ